MLPTTNVASVGFIISTVAAVYLAIVLHELGHAAAATCAGFRVVACGIGFRRPFFSFRCGGMVLYLARPFTVGLTLFVPDHFAVSRGRAIIAIAGGPAANCLTALVMFGLWQFGIQAGLVVALFYVSCLLFLVSVIPSTFTSRGLTIPNDGRQMMHHWRRTLAQLEQPGQFLGMFAAFRELCRDLNAPLGTSYSTLGCALYHADLHDSDSSVELLDELLDEQSALDGARPLAGHPLDTIVRCSVATAQGHEDVGEQLQDALVRFPNDPPMLAELRMLEADVALCRGRPAGEAARQAVEHAKQSGLPYLVSAAEALLLEADPPADLLQPCQELLTASGPRKLPRLVALRLACAATKILADRGQANEARTMFQEANSRLIEIASAIEPDVTRQRFLAGASKPLKAALNATDEGIPLFVGTDLLETEKPSNGKSGRRRLIRWPALLGAVLVGSFLGAYLAIRDTVRDYDHTANFEPGIEHTEQVFEMVDAAQEEAAKLAHEYAGVEHYLLAIVSAAPPSSLVSELDISASQVRSEIYELMPEGPNPTLEHDEQWLPSSERLNQALSVAIFEAEQLNAEAVTSDHVLLAILRQTETVAAKVMSNQDVDFERARNVLRTLDPAPARETR